METAGLGLASTLVMKDARPRLMLELAFSRRPNEDHATGPARLKSGLKSGARRESGAFRWFKAR